MADQKTIPNDLSVNDFVNSIAEQTKQDDCKLLLRMLGEISGEPAVMWGDSIVGFGKYHYVYASGREGDMFLTGFSPRKRQLTVYVMNGFSGYGEQLAKLGKHKHSVSCLYINRLDDIDLDVLRKMLEDSVRQMRTKYT